MARIAGVKLIRDTKGKPKKLQIDLEKVKGNEMLQDLVDGMQIDALRKEPAVSWEEAKSKLKKKHKLR